MFHLQISAVHFFSVIFGPTFDEKGLFHFPLTFQKLDF